MSFEASGRGGEVLVGYRRAALLDRWAIVKREEMLGDPVTTLEGSVENLDRFWSGFDRVTVKLNMNGCRWVWDQAEVQSWEPLSIWLYDAPRSEELCQGS